MRSAHSWPARCHSLRQGPSAGPYATPHQEQAKASHCLRRVVLHRGRETSLVELDTILCHTQAVHACWCQCLYNALRAFLGQHVFLEDVFSSCSSSEHRRSESIVFRAWMLQQAQLFSFHALGRNDATCSFLAPRPFLAVMFNSQGARGGAHCVEHTNTITRDVQQQVSRPYHVSSKNGPQI